MAESAAKKAHDRKVEAEKEDHKSVSSPSGATANAIVEKAIADPSKGYGEIAAEVREEVPGATTTGKSVASTLSRERRAGHEIPDRTPDAEPGSSAGQEQFGEETQGQGRPNGNARRG